MGYKQRKERFLWAQYFHNFIFRNRRIMKSPTKRRFVLIRLTSSFLAVIDPNIIHYLEFLSKIMFRKCLLLQKYSNWRRLLTVRRKKKSFREKNSLRRNTVYWRRIWQCRVAAHANQIIARSSRSRDATNFFDICEAISGNLKLRKIIPRMEKVITSCNFPPFSQIKCII